MKVGGNLASLQVETKAAEHLAPKRYTALVSEPTGTESWQSNDPIKPRREWRIRGRR